MTFHALAFFNELKAVDAACERLLAGSAARFVGTEDVGDIAERFHAVGYCRFEEWILGGVSGGPLGEIIRRHDIRNSPGGSNAHRNQARTVGE